MPTYDLIWAPEGRKIATVIAKDQRAARRKAPKPYRKFLGEIAADEVNPRKWIDITAEQFAAARNTSYTGGASWFRVPSFPGGCAVFAGTPMEVRQYFSANPDKTVRFEFVADAGVL